MSEVKELLIEELKQELNSLEEFEFGSEEHKVANETIGKLLDKLNDAERIEAESRDKEEARKLERELKEKQMEEDRKDRRFKNGIAVGTLIVSAAGAILMPIWGTNKTLKFEETGTVTTFAGRAFINKLFPKK